MTINKGICLLLHLTSLDILQLKQVRNKNRKKTDTSFSHIILPKSREARPKPLDFSSFGKTCGRKFRKYQSVFCFPVLGFERSLRLRIIYNNKL
jgi:hypothetical protein